MPVRTIRIRLFTNLLEVVLILVSRCMHSTKNQTRPVRYVTLRYVIVRCCAVLCCAVVAMHITSRETKAFDPTIANTDKAVPIATYWSHNNRFYKTENQSIQTIKQTIKHDAYDD